MKNKWIMTAGVAAALIGLGATVQADPILTLSDNNGNSVSVNAVNGVATYAGALGDWTINVTTGIASPPTPGLGTVTAPYIDLSTVDIYMGAGGAGNTLTISWAVDGLGPLTDSFLNEIGGTTFGAINNSFNVLVNGQNVLSTSSFGANTVGLGGGADSTVTLQDVLTATACGGTSFDHQLSSVPDGGTTVLLLGAALSGLALFRRRIAA